VPHETELLIWADLLHKVFGVIFCVGLFQLFVVRKRLLPVRTRWIIVIMAAGFIVNMLSSYYFNQAEHYRLYMSGVSLETSSLALLALILIGLAARRAKRDPAEISHGQT
jgi:Co/Zn/Cd efflux system component